MAQGTWCHHNRLQFDRVKCAAELPKMALYSAENKQFDLQIYPAIRWKNLAPVGALCNGFYWIKVEKWKHSHFGHRSEPDKVSLECRRNADNMNSESYNCDKLLLTLNQIGCTERAAEFKMYVSRPNAHTCQGYHESLRTQRSVSLSIVADCAPIVFSCALSYQQAFSIVIRISHENCTMLQPNRARKWKHWL